MTFERFLASGRGRLPAPFRPECRGEGLSPALAGLGVAVSPHVASGDEDCVSVCGPSVVAVETVSVRLCCCFEAFLPRTEATMVARGPC